MSLCPFPIQIRDPTDQLGRKRIPVPCGKCHVCLKRRRDDWTIRLTEHAKEFNYVKFLTLTYNEENAIHVGYEQTTLYKPHLKGFFKSLRKSYSFNYYAIGEYGTKTYRAHYHVILFSNCDIPFDILQKKWKYGNIAVSNGNIRRLTYITKYHVNRTAYPPETEPPFALMSKGIGVSYVERMRNHHSTVENSYYSQFQFKKSLPRYYREKLYNKYQRKLISEKYKPTDDDLINEVAEYVKKYPESSYWKIKHQKLMAARNAFKSKVNHNNTF